MAKPGWGGVWAVGVGGMLFALDFRGARTVGTHWHLNTLEMRAGVSSGEARVGWGVGGGGGEGAGGWWHTYKMRARCG